MNSSFTNNRGLDCKKGDLKSYSSQFKLQGRDITFTNFAAQNISRQKMHNIGTG